MNLRKSRFESVLVCASIAASVYILVSSLIIVRNAYYPLPFEDIWFEWRRYLTHGSYLSFLFAEHNEHRIVVPRLFYLVDRFVFHARNLFPLISSLLLQAATGVLLYRIARRGGEFRKSSRVLLGCVICSALFSAQQFPNLVQAFQIQFTVLYFSVCGSILALVLAEERREAGGRPEMWFALSFVLALAASYTSANGLLCWPLLLLLSLWLRMPLKYRLILAAGMVLVSGLYLWGYQTPSEHSQPLQAITGHFTNVCMRAAIFVGSPSEVIYAIVGRVIGLHSRDARIGMAAVCGFAGIAVALWATILLWRRRERYTKGHAALILVALFVILTGIMVGLGRANLPLHAAADSRYRTHALVFWVVVAAFYWQLLEPRVTAQRIGLYRIALAAAVTCIIAGMALLQPSWMEFSKHYGNTQSQIQAAIVADVYDPIAWRHSFPFPPYGTAIVGPVDYLRKNRLSVFTEEWTRWTGQTLRNLFTVDATPECMGSFDAIEQVESSIKPGWRVSGWAWDWRRQTGPVTVILADDAGQIAGVVRNTVERADVPSMAREVQSTHVGWSGYVAGADRKHLTAYLVEQDGHSLCPVGDKK